MIDRTHAGFRCNVRYLLRTVKGNLPRGSEGTVCRYRKLLRKPSFFLGSLLAALVLLTAPGLRDPSWAGPVKSPLHVSARAGGLTVEVSEVPLNKLLEEIARQTGVKVQVYGDSRITGKKISVEFHDVTIEAGLKRLLNGYNHLFFFSGSAGGNSHSRRRLTEVWLFPGGERIASEPTADQALGRVPLSREQKDRLDASPRLNGVNLGSQDPDQTAIPVLLESLQDPGQAVGVAAINGLSGWGHVVPTDRVVEMGLGHVDPQTRLAVLNSSLPLSSEVLVHHALFDPAPSVRAEALLQVPMSELGSEQVVREALRDPDPSVQALAQEMLERMEANRTR